MINADLALLQRYTVYLTNHRGLTENTSQGYLSDVRAFLNYAADAGVAIDDMDHGMLLRYTYHLHETGWVKGNVVNQYSRPTLRRKRCAIRTFYSFLTYEGHFATTPIPFLWERRMKAPEKLPPVLVSRRHVQRLMESADSTTPLGLRDRAILEVLYATGATVSELCAMGLRDVNFRQKRILVTGRRDRQRQVLFGDPAKDALRSYVDNGRPALCSANDDGDDALFVNRYGARLSRQGVDNIVRAHARKAGLVSGISAHTLRHAFAFHLLYRHINVRCLQSLLGHSDLLTTARIETNVHWEAGQALRLFHPLSGVCRKTTMSSQAHDLSADPQKRSRGSQDGASDAELLRQPFVQKRKSKRN